MENKFRVIRSFTLSAVITVIFIAAITVFADLQPVLKNWLTNTFFHHWIGKSILASALFFALGIIFFVSPLRVDEEKPQKNLSLLFWTSITGTLAIALFFIYETLVK